MMFFIVLRFPCKMWNNTYFYIKYRKLAGFCKNVANHDIVIKNVVITIIVVEKII